MTRHRTQYTAANVQPSYSPVTARKTLQKLFISLEASDLKTLEPPAFMVRLAKQPVKYDGSKPPDKSCQTVFCVVAYK